jgi:hypothetical protein
LLPNWLIIKGGDIVGPFLHWLPCGLPGGLIGFAYG